nr:hypothetical protein [Tanacetum cinerariifolium]
MSDSNESGVTYTEVSSPFEDLSNIGSPRADDHEHLELPGMLKDPYIEVALQAPPSPDYIPGPEKPEQAPPFLDYVPGLEHADDEIVAEDQPRSAAAARPVGGLQADYDFVATMDREIRRDPEREVGYGITNSWDEIVETLQGAPVSTDTELGGYMREFETRVKRDTDEIYSRLDDEQSERKLLAGLLNMLFRERHAHAYTRHLMKTKARLSREAWKKMAPKRTTRATAYQETTNTTLVTNAQLQAMIDQGVTFALAARDALKSTNGNDSHHSGMGVRRT